jgi:demethylmenaquinone methyltransferase/2-methoxy-6-polyprenyl-1,4-benzoquinol methylase
MFNDIAPRYDFLNHFLSLGIDRYWRRVVIRALKHSKPIEILDIATGTADLAILEAKKIKESRVTGIDIAEAMLQLGKMKVEKRKLTNRVALQYGDGQNIPFSNSSFDATTVAFGLRNFENPVQGIHEMYRVIKPGGVSIILEFSVSRNRLFSWIFDVYFGKILPFAGRLVSGHSKAYSYLPESVGEFNKKCNVSEIMAGAGFEDICAKRLTFGVATLYSGTKKL